MTFQQKSLKTVKQGKVHVFSIGGGRANKIFVSP
jgi:hypothetical protein